MANENYQTKKSQPIFPEESSLAIEKILEKYGLAELQQEGLDKISELGDFNKASELLENLPGTKIAKLVRDYAEGKISLEGLPILLEKELNVSEKEAKEIAKDLEKTLLIFIKQAPAEKLSIRESSEEISSNEREIEPEIISGSEEKKEEPKTSFKHDIYREPIE